jgi:uncharacterized protein (TIGR02452 family)
MCRLTLLPCIDSEAARRCELEIPFLRAAELGETAVSAVERGRYSRSDGGDVDWSRAVKAARSAKRSIPPEATLPEPDGSRFVETRVQVANETTLRAGRKLVERGLRPLALNFANGAQPGGGFLGGARAQEEVLCRSSALHATLVDDPMYVSHRRRPRPDATEWAILSPDVPVFRQDDGTPLDEPWLLSFISCAAPYAPEIGQPESGDLLRARILRILAIARAHGYVTLVLGAWGCGNFGNDASRTAEDFRSALENKFRGAFREIVFAIADRSENRRTLGPFRDVFSPRYVGHTSEAPDD